MGIRSVAYLASTRVVAGVVVVIPVYCVAVMASFFAARFGTTFFYGQSTGVYDHYFYTFLSTTDLLWSFALALVMAVVIMLVHTYLRLHRIGRAGRRRRGRRPGSADVPDHFVGGGSVRFAGHLRSDRPLQLGGLARWPNRGRESRERRRWWALATADGDRRVRLRHHGRVQQDVHLVHPGDSDLRSGWAGDGGQAPRSSCGASRSARSARSPAARTQSA